MIRRLMWIVVSVFMFVGVALSACGNAYAQDTGNSNDVGASAPEVVMPASEVLALQHIQVDSNGLVHLNATGLRAITEPTTYADRKRGMGMLLGGSLLFLLLSLVLIVFLVALIRMVFWAEAAKHGSDKWRKYLVQLPLGAPEGSVRALISLFIVVFGFIVLAAQSYLGLDNANAISGFVGSIIAFYFTSRNSDQIQKAVEQAHNAAKDTTETVAGAIKTATTAATEAQHATATNVTSNSQAAVDSASKATALILDKVKTATSTDSQSTTATQPSGDLQTIHDQLSSMQQVAHAASTLGIGTDILPDAAATLATLNDLLGKVEPLLQGNPDPSAVQAAVDATTKQLPALNAAGVPGALASALAVFKRVAGPAATILAGLPGGPVGLVAGVLTAGIQLAGDRQREGPLKNALLNRPFDPASMPTTPNADLAKAALAAAPLMSTHFSADDSAQALFAFLLDKLKNGAAPDTGAMATQAWATLSGNAAADGQVGFPTPTVPFASQAELLSAFEEYVGAVIFATARDSLGGTVQLPAVAGLPDGSKVDLPSLVNAARALLPDPKASAELERLVYVAQALGKLPVHPDNIAAIASTALTAALTTPVTAEPQEPAALAANQAS
jgi:hypothetical protein